MKLPEKCLSCGIEFNVEKTRAFLMIRTEPDFDSCDESRIEDQIYECSKCHALFRARWKLIDFKLLKEVSTGFHDVEKFYRDEPE